MLGRFAAEAEHRLKIILQQCACQWALRNEHSEWNLVLQKQSIFLFGMLWDYKHMLHYEKALSFYSYTGYVYTV